MVFLDVFVHLVNPDYSLSKMIAAAFFVKAVPYMQMWYVPFIVGVYIGLPFLACIVKSFPGKMLAVFFAALSIIILLLPTIGIFFHVPDFYLLKNVMYGIGYNSYSVLYLLAGYYLGHGSVSWVKRRSTTFFVILFCVLFLANWFLQQYAYFCGHDAKFGYEQITSFYASICLFIVLLRMCKGMKYHGNMFYQMVYQLSRLSFGVYFLHAPLQHLLILSGILNRIDRPVAVLLIFVVSAIFVNCFLYTIACIPVLARVLLNTKV